MLEYFFDRADELDRRDGMGAYNAYHEIMTAFAEQYETDRPKVTAAFCALSPNSDYFGNLRSLHSVLRGVKVGIPDDRIVVSTYGACKSRALSFLRGDQHFMTATKGLKTRAFWTNIERPDESGPVTIDGHMKAAWLGLDALTMRQAAVRTVSEYKEISEAVFDLADAKGVLPHQAQAVVWMARKRILRIKFNAQLSLFSGSGLVFAPKDIPPYPFRQEQ